MFQIGLTVKQVDFFISDVMKVGVMTSVPHSTLIIVVMITAPIIAAIEH